MMETTWRTKRERTPGLVTTAGELEAFPFLPMIRWATRVAPDLMARTMMDWKESLTTRAADRTSRARTIRRPLVVAIDPVGCEGGLVLDNLIFLGFLNCLLSCSCRLIAYVLMHFSVYVTDDLWFWK